MPCFDQFLDINFVGFLYYTYFYHSFQHMAPYCGVKYKLTPLDNSVASDFETKNKMDFG